jgi:small-conductance mechanosensitive channel
LGAKKDMATENDFFARAVSPVTGFFSRILEGWFGPGVHKPVVGPMTWADLAVAALPVLFVLLLNAVLAFVFRHQVKKTNDPKHWRTHFFGKLGAPIYTVLWLGAAYLALSPFLFKFFQSGNLRLAHHVANVVFGVVLFVALLWLCLRLTRVAEVRLTVWAEKFPSKAVQFVVPLFGRSLRMLFPILAIVFALPIFLPQEYAPIFGRINGILIILGIAWIFFQAVDLGEKALLAQYDISVADNLQARKVYTQARVIGRTIHVAIAVFTVACILMLFQEVRHIGASMLASAGIVGIVAGIAAQNTLANLIAGFQIALAQPIRLDDVVIVENEWGRIEEITLTYVVVHIWDDRRLVMPLSYFIEKPFQNWTRATAQLLGSVFVWVDYTFPVDEARKALKEIVESQPLWDKRFWNLQVSDADEKTMQLRVLATAEDASKAWTLRCAIREEFIAYIQKNHPQCLPKIRAELGSVDVKAEANKLR